MTAPSRSSADEDRLIRDADARARRYIAGIDERRVFPAQESIAALAAFEEPLPESGYAADDTLRLLDDVGSPATAVTNGPRYFGFVIGAALPSAAAAERLMLAWDQGLASPAVAAIERIAAGWVLEILDLPRESAVGFGTSATSCGLSCLSAAYRALQIRAGWDVDRHGTALGPRVRAVVSAQVHVAIRKGLRILGLGTDDIVVAPTDAQGRIIPSRLPFLDEGTILCLQAGEVNTGEFDPFDELIDLAERAGAWVHVDGAFGLWARATGAAKSLTQGVDRADSWAIDGHKWLNTPYDCAMAICRRPDDLASAMNSDAVYAPAGGNAQRNLTLDFSRRARGIPVWASLRSLGRSGVDEMVMRNLSQASATAERLRAAGYEILNRVVLNQVLVRCASDEDTRRVLAEVQASGEVWFGPTSWQGRAAFRISFSSWRTTADDVERLCRLMERIRPTKA